MTTERPKESPIAEDVRVLILARALAPFAKMADDVDRRRGILTDIPFLTAACADARAALREAGIDEQPMR